MRRLAILAMMVGPLLGADGDFAGSAACGRCHAEIYRAYLKTPMAVSAGAVGSESLQHAEFTHPGSGFRYRIRKQGDRYMLAFDGSGGVSGSVPLTYFIGSGTVARSYVWNAGAFLFEAPVAYYTRERTWNLQPGYGQYSYPFLTRPIATGCLECHASRVRPLEGTLNGFASPPFLENGVSCERCHGPAADHAAGGKAVVNPARLDPERRDSVCAQCHLSGEQRVVRAGHEGQTFRAGERLADSLAVFVRADAASGMKVTSHVEKLAQSACKNGAGDRLWCGTCHDPHRLPAPQQRAAWFRSKCQTCHEPTACRAQAAARKSRGDDCTACHMPKNAVVDAEHVVYTDHSIPRRPRPAVAEKPPTELVLFGGGVANPRDLGMAYAMLADRTGNEIVRARAFELLRGQQLSLSNDPRALLYLADHYRRINNDAGAVPLYERARQLDAAQATAGASLGAIQMERGQYNMAIQLWRDALAKNPGLVLVRFNMANALLRLGDVAGARAELEKTLEFNPAFTAAAKLLDELKKR